MKDSPDFQEKKKIQIFPEEGLWCLHWPLLLPQRGCWKGGWIQPLIPISQISQISLTRRGSDSSASTCFISGEEQSQSVRIRSSAIPAAPSAGDG